MKNHQMSYFSPRKYPFRALNSNSKNHIRNQALFCFCRKLMECILTGRKTTNNKLYTRGPSELLSGLPSNDN